MIMETPPADVTNGKEKVKAGAPLPFLAAKPPLVDIAGGLELLSRLPPLWPISTGEWSLAVATVRAFAEAWDGLANGVDQ